MKQIENIQQAIEIFKESSINHGITTQAGNFTLGNEIYKSILLSAQYLKENHSLGSLKELLINPDPSVRLWSAVYFLNVDEKLGKKTLSDLISEKESFFSFEAETTLEEWEKGNLRF